MLRAKAQRRVWESIWRYDSKISLRLQMPLAAALPVPSLSGHKGVQFFILILSVYLLHSLVLFCFFVNPDTFLCFLDVPTAENGLKPRHRPLRA